MKSHRLDAAIAEYLADKHRRGADLPDIRLIGLPDAEVSWEIYDQRIDVTVQPTDPLMRIAAALEDIAEIMRAGKNE